MQFRNRTSISQTGVIIAAGAAVLALSFGARSIFGIVLDPISTEYGWPREVFSLSLAIQNLTWGIAQPAFGMVADRFGDRRAMWLGFGLYLAGMLLTATGYTPWMQHLGAGVLVGMGVSGTGFGLVLSAVGRGCTEASPTPITPAATRTAPRRSACGRPARRDAATRRTDAYATTSCPA